MERGVRKQEDACAELLGVIFTAGSISPYVLKAKPATEVRFQTLHMLLIVRISVHVGKTVLNSQLGKRNLQCYSGNVYCCHKRLQVLDNKCSSNLKSVSVKLTELLYQKH